MKVKCYPKRRHTTWRVPGWWDTELTEILPFARTRCSTMQHRCRSGTVFYRHGQYSHAAVHLWCGNALLTKCGLRLSDKPDQDLPICGTCEGRACGAGQLGSQEIAGRPVLFRPRMPVAKK